MEALGFPSIHPPAEILWEPNPSDCEAEPSSPLSSAPNSPQRSVDGVTNEISPVVNLASLTLPDQTPSKTEIPFDERFTPKHRDSEIATTKGNDLEEEPNCQNHCSLNNSFASESLLPRFSRRSPDRAQRAPRSASLPQLMPTSCRHVFEEKKECQSEGLQSAANSYESGLEMPEDEFMIEVQKSLSTTSAKKQQFGELLPSRSDSTSRNLITEEGLQVEDALIDEEPPKLECRNKSPVQPLAERNNTNGMQRLVAASTSGKSADGPDDESEYVGLCEVIEEATVDDEGCLKSGKSGVISEGAPSKPISILPESVDSNLGSHLDVHRSQQHSDEVTDMGPPSFNDGVYRVSYVTTAQSQELRKVSTSMHIKQLSASDNLGNIPRSASAPCYPLSGRDDSFEWNQERGQEARWVLNQRERMLRAVNGLQDGDGDAELQMIYGVDASSSKEQPQRGVSTFRAIRLTESYGSALTFSSAQESSLYTMSSLREALDIPLDEGDELMADLKLPNGDGIVEIDKGKHPPSREAGSVAHQTHDDDQAKYPPCREADRVAHETYDNDGTVEPYGGLGGNVVDCTGGEIEHLVLGTLRRMTETINAGEMNFLEDNEVDTQRDGRCLQADKQSEDSGEEFLKPLRALETLGTVIAQGLAGEGFEENAETRDVSIDFLQGNSPTRSILAPKGGNLLSPESADSSVNQSEISDKKLAGDVLGTQRNPIAVDDTISFPARESQPISVDEFLLSGDFDSTSEDKSTAHDVPALNSLDEIPPPPPLETLEYEEKPKLSSGGGWWLEEELARREALRRSRGPVGAAELIASLGDKKMANEDMMERSPPMNEKVKYTIVGIEGREHKLSGSRPAMSTNRVLETSPVKSDVRTSNFAATEKKGDLEFLAEPPQIRRVKEVISFEDQSGSPKPEQPEPADAGQILGSSFNREFTGPSPKLEEAKHEPLPNQPPGGLVCDDDQNSHESTECLIDSIEQMMGDLGQMAGSRKDIDDGWHPQVSESRCIDLRRIVHRCSSQDSASDPDPLADGIPPMVRSINNDIGIPKGDIMISLLNEKTDSTWASRVEEATWRCRIMRRNCDPKWMKEKIKRDPLSPSLARTSIKVDVDDARVVGGIGSLSTTENAALEHLKFDDFDDALFLYESILDSYNRYIAALGENQEMLQPFELQRLIDEFQPHVGAVLHNLGIVHMLRNDFEEALCYLERATQIREHFLAPGHLDHVASLAKMASCLFALERFGQAHRALQECYAFLTATAQTLADQRQLAEIVNNLGCMAYMTGQVDSARQFFRRSLDIQVSILEHALYAGSKFSGHTSSLNLSITRANIGFLSMVGREISSCIDYLESAVTAQQLLLRDAHTTLISTMDHLVVANLLAERKDKAIQMLRRMLHMQLDAFGPNDMRYLVTKKKIELLVNKEENTVQNDTLQAALEQIPTLDSCKTEVRHKRQKSILNAINPRRRKYKEMK